MWENVGDDLLETTFDSCGAVLQQQLLKLGELKLESRINEVLRSASITTTEDKPYEEVRLMKPCPGCGNDSLVRSAKSVSGDALPIVPTYTCKDCNAKSYHLKTEYLEHLVDVNKGLFDHDELLEHDKNRGAFIKELEEYILRIFASKKIKRIL